MTSSSGTCALSRPTTFLLAGLMVLSTGLFVAGVWLERSRSSTGTTSTSAVHVATPAPAAEAAPEGSEAREAQERQEAPTTEPRADEEGSAAPEAAEQNQIFGIDVESPWVIASVVLVTLLLIVGLFLFGTRVLPLVVLVAVVATVFDMRELGYQLGQARYLIAALAIGVVISRIATAFFAWRAWRMGDGHVHATGAS